MARAARRARGGPLSVVREGAVVTLTLEAGEAAPCLTPELHGALASAAAEIDLDEDVRVVVLRAAGPGFRRSQPAGVQPPAEGVADGIAAVAALRVPVVALLGGDVVDEGLELALACDLRIASSGARLGMLQLARGTLPRHGGSQRLPRLVGRSRALAMMLLGETLAAREALATGLVQQVVPAARLPGAGRTVAARIAARAPIAQRLGKEALRAALDLPLTEGLRLEGDLYVLLQTTRDRDEGIASFREKRRPRFVGR